MLERIHRPLGIMPVEQLNIQNEAHCILFDGKATRRDGQIILNLWGQDKTISFPCTHEVHIISYLLEPVREKNNAHVLHKLSIKCHQHIELIIRDNGDVTIEQLAIESLMLTGRTKLLNQRLGIYDTTKTTLDIIQSLGNELRLKLNVKNAHLMTEMRHYKDGVISSTAQCPYCGGLAVYNNYMNDMKNPTKECGHCGWRGFEEFYDGDGGLYSIPLTKTVRSYLNQIGLANADDKYEYMFANRLKPEWVISRLKKYAKRDWIDARRLLKSEN